MDEAQVFVLSVQVGKAQPVQESLFGEVVVGGRWGAVGPRMLAG